MNILHVTFNLKWLNVQRNITFWKPSWAEIYLIGKLADQTEPGLRDQWVIWPLEPPITKSFKIHHIQIAVPESRNSGFQPGFLGTLWLRQQSMQMLRSTVNSDSSIQIRKQGFLQPQEYFLRVPLHLKGLKPLV